MVKRVISLFCFLILFGCSYNGPVVKVKDDVLSFQYDGYEVITNFKIDQYRVKKDKNHYIIHCTTKDDNDLNIKFQKNFKGNIEVTEKVNLRDYHYSYKFRGHIKDNGIDFNHATMMGEKNVNVAYNSEYKKSYCRYKGYVDITPIKNKDTYYLNNQFYVTEEGIKRCEIDKRFSMVLKRL